MNLNWKLLGLGGAGLIIGAISLINSAASEYFKSVAEERAAAEVTDETKEEINKAEATIEKADAVRERERKEIYDEIRTWKRNNEYDEKISAAHMNTISELADFKRSIGYYNRKQDIEDEYDNGIAAFKESIDYDYEISLEETKIEEAKKLYEERCEKIEDASDSDDAIAERLKDLEKDEKKKMDASVKEAKEKIEALKAKLNSEEQKLNKKKQSDLRDLEGELQSTKTRLAKTEEEICSKLNKEKNTAEDKIRSSVLGKRTEDEDLAIQECDNCKSVLDKYKNNSNNRVLEIHNAAPRSEKWAAYLSNKKCPKWVVIVIGSLPLIPAGYIIERYIKFVYGIVKAM